MIITTLAMLAVLAWVMILGLGMGSAEKGFMPFLRAMFSPGEADPLLSTIIWEIRFPRVIVAALVGATLSL
ncbi:MAG: iron chelate uptake ABC transporter family permease subunit, partial [Desulfobacterales bacterium]